MFDIVINDNDLNKYDEYKDQCSIKKIDWLTSNNLSFWIKFFIQKDKSKRDVKDFCANADIDERTFNQYIKEKSPTQRCCNMSKKTFKKLVIEFGESPDFNILFEPSDNESVNKYFADIILSNYERYEQTWYDCFEDYKDNSFDKNHKIKKRFCGLNIFKCCVVNEYIGIFKHLLMCEYSHPFLLYYCSLHGNSKKQFEKYISKIQIPIMDLYGILEDPQIKLYSELKALLKHSKGQNEVDWIKARLERYNFRGRFSEIKGFLWEKLSENAEIDEALLPEIIQALATINLADIKVLIAFEVAENKRELFYIVKGLYDDQESKKGEGNFSALRAMEEREKVFLSPRYREDYDIQRN